MTSAENGEQNSVWDVRNWNAQVVNRTRHGIIKKMSAVQRREERCGKAEGGGT